MTAPYRGRFAPSPTGPLHFGALVAAFGSWLMARRARGEWLVRIEDLDSQREVAGAADAQLRSLVAHGLVADGPVLRQSTCGARYGTLVDQLLQAGDAFSCHCARSHLAADGGIHRACVPGTRRTDPSVRLRVSDGTVVAFEDAVHGRIEQDVAAVVGDVVLRRADGFWAYQLAVVVDDADQGITDVVRGADLLDSTPRQILLQQHLGLPTPRYLHLPLVLGDDGRKLSKSSDAPAIDDGHPLPSLRAAWQVLGQSANCLDTSTTTCGVLQAAVAAFEPARIPRTPHAVLAASHNSPARRDE